MKQIKHLSIITAFVIALISGCQEKKSEYQIIEEKQKAELASGIRNDTIFLGFYFGMTEEQVNEKFKELIRKGKVYVNAENQYQYDFTFVIIKKATSSFSFAYQSDKLYKMTLSVESKDEYIKDSKALQLQLRNLYSKKYGYDCIKLKPIVSNKEDEFDYMWVQGNRQIEIYEGIGDARIIYTDMKAEIESKKIEKDKDQKKINETRNDL